MPVTGAVKHIVLIRHGESEGNVAKVYQGSDAPLTPKGREQAQRVAERVAHLRGIGLIVASDMRRARETAETIQTRTNVPLVVEPLFRERKRPSSFVRRRRDDPSVQAWERTIREHFGEPGFRFEDEETYEELVARADRALTWLAERPEQGIIVVSHGFFLRLLLARAVLQDALTPSVLLRFVYHTCLWNTGLSELHYLGEEAHYPWRLITLNDRAHFGE